MLYELIGIVRPSKNFAEVKEIVFTAGKTVLSTGGVIRSIANWGEFRLPRAITVNQARYERGNYFVMRYDGSIAAQDAIKNALRLDARVIRSSTVKLGDGKLESMSKFGKVHWERAFRESERDAAGRR